MNAHGTVHKYGDHVDTDVIIPARYLASQNHQELASHCMEDIDKTFVTKVKDGAIGGVADSFLAKNKARTIDAKLARATKWFGAVFLVLTMALLIMN